jgi:hypothetical protein
MFVAEIVSAMPTDHACDDTIVIDTWVKRIFVTTYHDGSFFIVWVFEFDGLTIVDVKGFPWFMQFNHVVLSPFCFISFVRFAGVSPA